MSKQIVGILGLVLSLSGYAELIVIADYGGESAVRYYEGIQPEHDETAPVRPHALPAQVSEADMLPVVSHKLSVGQVTPKSLQLKGMPAIFLLGADDVSAQWLSQQRQRLTALKATGLVVNVNTADELQALRQIAPELRLFPVSGDDLAMRIPLSHYPALITETGVSQ